MNEPGRCQRCGASLDPTEACAACLLDMGTVPPEAPDLAGELLGPYKIGRVLGQGGMGVVYEAVDTRPKSLWFGQTVALKILLEGLDAPDQLVREAQLLAALEHQHIVPVYEVGEHEGIAYFTMKRIDGGPLPARAPNARRAAEIALAIAQAVEFAHRHGILHRDLKPANVLIDRAWRPFVTDFGLAAQEELAAGAALAPGGTPAYMAPEVWRGDPGAASTAADVWGAGAILYELLAGRPPFDGSSWDELKQQVTAKPPPPLAGVHADLAAVCLRCLEKEPARRYATAGDLAEDLASFLAGDPVKARPLGRIARGLRRAARHPVVTALSVLLIIAASAGAVSALMLDRAQHATLLAEQDALRAEQDRLRAEQDRLHAEQAGFQRERAVLRSADVTVQSLARLTAVQFDRYTAVVEAAGRDTSVARAAAKPASKAASEICKRLLAKRDGPNASPFATWFLLDAGGTMIGYAPVPKHDIMGRSFKFRDYYRGAEEIEKQGRRSAYVSRAYRSESDDDYEIAISVAVHDDTDRWLGLLVATFPTGSAFGSIDIDDPGDESFTAALLAPRGPERNESAPNHEPIFILRRGLGRGEALAVGAGNILGADLDGGALVRVQQVRGTPFSVLVRFAYDDPRADPAPTRLH